MHLARKFDFGRLGMPAFLLALLANCVLYLAVGFLVVPIGLVRPVSLVVSVFAVALPITALYFGASAPRKWFQWLILGAFGAALQFGLSSTLPAMRNPLELGIVFAISQAGLIVWCLGLGGLLASCIRDKNLLLPLAAFLAIFDFWLVFVPEGPVGKIARGNQKALSQMAYHIPNVSHVSHGGHAASLAYVGPADFMFLGMFFVALFRFKMRTTTTFYAILPVLAAYLLTVLIAGNVHIGPISLGAMPALIPIGATVLIVNWREFNLTRDEKLSSALIVILGIGVVIWRMSLALHYSMRPFAPSRTERGQETGALPNSPLPTFSNRPPIRNLPARESKPSPP
jgi:hypothetical protein